MRRLLLFLLLLLPFSARADDLQLELRDKALRGQGQPALVLIANKTVSQATVRLTGPGEKRLTLRAGSIQAGHRQELSIDAPVGRSRWAGTLVVTFADGTEGEMPLSFSVYVSEGLRFERLEGEGEFDAKAGTLRFAIRGGQPSHCEYTVTFDGKPERKGVTRFGSEVREGDPVVVSWAPHGDDDVVLRIALVCHDTETFFFTHEVFPWKVTVAHDDVIFETGKWDIPEHERPKLDAVLETIRTTIRRYGEAIPKGMMKLYVAGHTDTVGDAASNMTLSLRRAEAIARYFRDRGVTIPILYTGFGESRPLVATPDESDEPRNRRADYFISVEDPLPARWRKL